MRVVDCLRFEKRRNKGIAPYGPLGGIGSFPAEFDPQET
jgi:hypothetical protein